MFEICLLFIDKVLFSFIQIQLSTDAALCVLCYYLYICLIVTVFCLEFGLYRFRVTLPSAAAVLYDEHQLVWVQPGTILALILTLLILYQCHQNEYGCSSEWSRSELYIHYFSFLSSNFVNQLISFTTATTTATIATTTTAIVFDDVSCW